MGSRVDWLIDFLVWSRDRIRLKGYLKQSNNKVNRNILMFRASLSFHLIQMDPIK